MPIAHLRLRLVCILLLIAVSKSSAEKPDNFNSASISSFFFLASLILSDEDDALLAPPEIVTRGFADGADAELMEKNLARIVYETLEYCERKNIHSINTIKSKLKANFSGFMYKTARRSPMIIVTISRI